MRASLGGKDRGSFKASQNQRRFWTPLMLYEEFFFRLKSPSCGPKKTQKKMSKMYKNPTLSAVLKFTSLSGVPMHSFFVKCVKNVKQNLLTM